MPLVYAAHNSLAVVDDACFFIPLQAVKKLLNAVAVCKFRKGACLDFFCIQPLTAFRRLTFIASVQLLCNDAFAVFAPFCVLAPAQVLEAVLPAAFTCDILRAQATRKPKVLYYSA